MTLGLHRHTAGLRCETKTPVKGRQRCNNMAVRVLAASVVGVSEGGALLWCEGSRMREVSTCRRGVGKRVACCLL